MLEQNKKMDETQQRMKTLQGVEETGRSTNSMNEEMCEIEVVIEESIQDFIQSASKYYGNPEIVLEWCEHWETHLFNSKWEKIPKRCKEDAGFMHNRSSQKRGLAFERYETGVFFAGML